LSAILYAVPKENEMKFKLIFPEDKLGYWSERNKANPQALISIGETAKSRGYLVKDEFLKICADKSPRSKSRCASNDPDLISEVTKISFSSKHEQIKIQSLMMLVGVSWPTASYILHFCAKEEYPVLDFQALWSLSINKPPVYTYLFWQEYTDFCRELARKNALSMRAIDSALWQYSKEIQK
jgi:hypothetical protein